MDHLAILSPKYHYLPKILSGQKSIESRWYKFRTAPWNRIQAGDTVYFKDSGKLVTHKAIVSQVLQFDHPSPAQLHQIVVKYGRQITANNLDVDEFFNSVADKNYIILLFLINPQNIKPFKINKSGFGSGCAWISIPDIRKITVY